MSQLGDTPTVTDISGLAKDIKAKLGEEDKTATFDAQLIRDADVDIPEEKAASWG